MNKIGIWGQDRWWFCLPADPGSVLSTHLVAHKPPLPGNPLSSSASHLYVVQTYMQILHTYIYIKLKTDKIC